jgi:hypothetical protein
MRRISLVLVVVTSAVLLLAPSASGLCLEAPFDQVVRKTDAVWWGAITGTQRIHTPDLFGWGLKIRVEDVLKGPATIGEDRVVMLNSCVPSLERPRSKDYVGRTQLFIGAMVGDILVSNGLILTPQGQSPLEQYQRALRDLGLHRSLASSPAPIAAGGSGPWGLVAAIVVVILVAGGSFLLARRRSADDTT